MNQGGTTIEAARLAIIADSPAVASLVREVLATTLPGIETEIFERGTTTLALAGIDCVLIDATANGEIGLDVLRRVRAAGYDRAAVMLLPSGGESVAERETVADAASLGARYVARDEVVESLGEAVVDAMAASSPAAAAERVREALRRTQRRLAAGDVALRMQHALNNPLAALLAEAQLLALEPLDEDHREAVDRIVELCRRVIGIVRQLDGVGAKKGDEPDT